MTAAYSRRGVLRAAGAAGVGCVLSHGPDAVPAAQPATRKARGTKAASATRPSGSARPDVIRESARSTPVVGRFDICVVGGSCTGVFAAIAAARMGAKVCVIESNGFFGGVATASLVNVWHSTFDTEGKTRIIAGLTTELMDRLKKRGAVIQHRPNASKHFTFNSAEMILELDALVAEAGVKPMLHTRFVAPAMQAGKVAGAIVEDKTGRRAVRAAYFIDATGDGDLVERMGLETYRDDVLQPPTVCVNLFGLDEVRKRSGGLNLSRVVFDRKYPEALKGGFLWTARVPGVPGATMVAGTRVHGADCSDADERTAAEIEGRRQVRAMCDLLRKHFKGGEHVAPINLPACIGIRETRHARCLHTLTEKEVLTGKRFDDAVANGSYRVDVHHPDKPGLTFRYQDGTEVYVSPTGGGKRTRWRPKTKENPTFYQVPYRSLVPKAAKNVLVAGRCLDADRGAFGAVRVMVNCNQTGQAAGRKPASSTSPPTWPSTAGSAWPTWMPPSCARS